MEIFYSKIIYIYILYIWAYLCNNEKNGFIERIEIVRKIKYEKWNDF